MPSEAVLAMRKLLELPNLCIAPPVFVDEAHVKVNSGFSGP
jgi:hypothetical protein